MCLPMRIEDKLTILADAAKYDVSCASSGSVRGNTSRGLGNAASCGICHTYTEDGRCVSQSNYDIRQMDWCDPSRKQQYFFYGMGDGIPDEQKR